MKKYILIALQLVPAFAFSQISYNYTQIVPPSGYYANTFGFNGGYSPINDFGQIVGMGTQTNGSTVNFYGTAPSNFTSIGNPPNSVGATGIYGINDSAEIVGFSDNSSSQPFAISWTPSSGYTELGTYTVFNSVNNSGEIAGTDGASAAIWSSTGSETLINSEIGNSDITQGSAINSSGAICGYGNDQAGNPFTFYRSSSGNYQYASFGTGIAISLNDSGQVLLADDGNGTQSIWSTQTNSYLSLPTEGGFGYFSQINNSEFAVGTGYNYSTGNNYGSLWTPTLGLLDLNSITSNLNGTTLQRAFSISNSGDIFVDGLSNGSIVDGVLTPQAVPEPSESALVCLGICSLILARKRLA